MTREDINDIINVICPNDEDYEKPCISPKYLRQELEQLVLDQKQWNEEPTIENDLRDGCIIKDDCISRQKVLRLLANSIGKSNTYIQTEVLKMSPVTPQEPRCKECKWWKDSDGEYRRGCGAESQCPINRREVFEGNGYCFLFEPQESEDKKDEKI